MDERSLFGKALCSSQRYADHDPRRPADKNPRIYVRVAIGENEVHAMVDTGAQWCIIPPPIGPSAPEDVSITTVHIRREAIRGRLARGTIALVADFGPSISIDATFFVPEPEHLEEGWRYPYFIGLEGALSRFYFGVDASLTWLHFGL